MGLGFVQSVSQDNATQSNYNDIRTENLHLEWDIDWEDKIFRGSVLHSMKALTGSVSQAIFDSSYLNIKKISGGSPKSKPTSYDELSYEVEARHPVLGNKLIVILKTTLKEGERINILIEYETTPQCTAVGWLKKEQTGSGKYPFLFSQCQAIHCRSLLRMSSPCQTFSLLTDLLPLQRSTSPPLACTTLLHHSPAPLSCTTLPFHRFPHSTACQDTPAVKLTYTANVTSPLPVLMSARRVSPPSTEPLHIKEGEVKTYSYKQPVTMPSYLIAVAAGELVFAAGVWEFKKDTEKFLTTAEELVTSYEWGRYDCLVLPSSFPYGGMENPCMTFLTPALITGDRSEVDVICHEISHSWFGNSVSVANWSSFWLNEGWTTYLERLIAHQLHGEDARSFEYIIGSKGLFDSLAKYQDDPKGQRLHIDYSFGEDPDAYFSQIPYDKGSNFLLYLERTVGGLDSFVPYMKDYFTRFHGLSITTDDWLSHFWTYWNQFPDKAKALKEVDFDAWLYGEGVYLPVKMEYDTSLADASYTLAEKWDKSRSATSFPFSKSDISKFTSKQTSLFLDTMFKYPAYGSAFIEALNSTYLFGESGNPEIKVRWFFLTLRAGLYAPEAAKWVEDQGRMKYCRPIYKAIYKVDPELAKRTFLESGVTFLHPIARRMIAIDLGIDQP